MPCSVLVHGCLRTQRFKNKAPAFEKLSLGRKQTNKEIFKFIMRQLGVGSTENNINLKK